MMTSDYVRIERALQVVPEGDRSQPSLDNLAADLGLSLSSCDHLVRRWSGVDPQTFLRILTSHRELARESWARMETHDSLLHSNSVARRDERVHVVDLRTSDQAQDERALDIRYGEHDSPFGRLFLAVTPLGICKLSFLDEAGHGDLPKSLEQTWPGTAVKADHETTAPIAAALFQPAHTQIHRFHVLLKGTEFQLKAWKTLLEVPMGKVCSYGQLARAIGQPKASRAVGCAVAANPVAYLIPCHRVIRGSGATGNYRWGRSRKRAMLFWEACKRCVDQAAVPDCAEQ
jgi:AraC family transcriptional regulator of adaptative response/methylated-DNA-[protein]-cysteine methyltransferase